MKIPKRFKLGAITWTVEEDPLLVNCLGMCNSLTTTIKLLPGLKPDVKEQTFCHELLHSLMFSTGRTDHDELLVDSLGVFLHQYLKQLK